MTTNLNERVRVGATIKVIRELRGLTQDQLASAAMLSRSQVANVEAGRKGVSRLVLPRIATALSVPAVSIMSAPDEAAA